jgi:hypothetical protein
LEVDHEPPRGIHAAIARPRLACEVSAENVEDGISLDGIQTAIRRCVGIICVQTPNQLRVFLDHDTQGEFRGRRHVTLLKLAPAAGQWSRKYGGQGRLRG